MARHLNIAAYLNLGFYGLVLLAIVLSYLNSLSSGAISIGVVGYALFLYAPYFIGAFAMLKRLPWSRTVMMILSALAMLSLFQAPLLSPIKLGALIGGYTIWVLWQKQTVQLLMP